MCGVLAKADVLWQVYFQWVLGLHRARVVSQPAEGAVSAALQ